MLSIWDKWLTLQIYLTKRAKNCQWWSRGNSNVKAKTIQCSKEWFLLCTWRQWNINRRKKHKFHYWVSNGRLWHIRLHLPDFSSTDTCMYVCCVAETRYTYPRLERKPAAIPEWDGKCYIIRVPDPAVHSLVPEPYLLRPGLACLLQGRPTGL